MTSELPLIEFTTDSTTYDLAAWAANAMSKALPRRSRLPVGCALASHRHREIIYGANIETQWQTSYHAEEVAIMGMVMAGWDKFDVLCIAADRELFTPCGACMDKILEFGGKDAIIYHFRPSNKRVTSFLARDLMPHYPTRD